MGSSDDLLSNPTCRDFRDFPRAAAVKPINPFPLIAMLVIVVFLVLWFNGVFT